MWGENRSVWPLAEVQKIHSIHSVDENMDQSLGMGYAKDMNLRLSSQIQGLEIDVSALESFDVSDIFDYGNEPLNLIIDRPESVANETSIEASLNDMTLHDMTTNCLQDSPVTELHLDDHDERHQTHLAHPYSIFAYDDSETVPEVLQEIHIDKQPAEEPVEAMPDAESMHSTLYPDERLLDFELPRYVKPSWQFNQYKPLSPIQELSNECLSVTIPNLRINIPERSSEAKETSNTVHLHQQDSESPDVYTSYWHIYMQLHAPKDAKHDENVSSSPVEIDSGSLLSLIKRAMRFNREMGTPVSDCDSDVRTKLNDSKDFIRTRDDLEPSEHDLNEEKYDLDVEQSTVQLEKSLSWSSQMTGAFRFRFLSKPNRLIWRHRHSRSGWFGHMRNIRSNAITRFKKKFGRRFKNKRQIPEVRRSEIRIELSDDEMAG